MKATSTNDNAEWTRATLGQLSGERGKSIEPAKTPENQFELYSVPSFPEEKPEVVFGKEVGSNKQLVEPRSVLLCKINPRINRVWVVGDFTPHPKIASTEWIVFPATEEIVPDFLCYFLQKNAVRDFLAHNASGVGGSLMRVKPSTIRDFPFEYPKLKEQHRIIVEIEKQFTRLEAGMAALRRVQANLKRYRAAILKTACEGRLDPTENWPIKTMRDVTSIVTKGSSPNWQGFDYCEDGVVFVRSQNVGWGKLNLSDVAHLPSGFNEKEKKSVLKVGDVLLNIVGASIGRAAIATSDVAGGNVNQAVAVIRCQQEKILPQFLMAYLLSPATQTLIHSQAVDVARANFSLGDISKMPVPIPSLAEQTQIVMEVERRLSVVDELESVVSVNLQRATRLRQSILQKAFAGELIVSKATHDVQLGLFGIPSNIIDIQDILQNRAALDAYILVNSPYDKNLGHTKMEKENHFIEYEAELDLRRNPVRDAAGPIDFSSRLAIEEEAKRQNWYSVVKYQMAGGKIRYEYVAGKNIAAAIPIAEKFMGARKQAVDCLIKLLKPLNTDQCSIVATLYAAWNDLLLLRKPDSDQAIIKESSDNWHREKKKISLADWNWGLNWLRKNNMIPKGRGKLIPPKNNFTGKGLKK